ncbi:MAG: hypothetical protein AAF599_00110 [Bacteroidota bacterium]
MPVYFWFRGSSACLELVLVGGGGGGGSFRQHPPFTRFIVLFVIPSFSNFLNIIIDFTLMRKLLLLTLFTSIVSIRVCFAQSVSTLTKENFSEIYNKAKKHLHSDLDSAYFFAQLSLHSASNKNQRCASLFMLGLVSNERGEFYQSILYYQSALDIKSTTDFTYSIKNNLSNSLLQYGKIKEAEELIGDVLKYRRKVKHKYIANTFNIKAEVMNRRGFKDSAMHYNKMAIVASKGNKRMLSELYNCLGDIEEDRSKAVSFYQQSLDYAVGGKMRALSNAKIAKCLILGNKLKEANKILSKITIVKDIKTLLFVQEVKALLAYKREDKKQFFTNLKRVDSVLDVAEIRLKKQDYALLLQTRKRMQRKLDTIAQTSTHTAQNQTYVMVLGFTALAFLISVVLFKNSKAANNQKQMLEKLEALRLQNIELKEQNEELLKVTKARDEKIQKMSGQLDIILMGEVIKTDVEARAIRQIRDYVLDHKNPALLNFVEEQVKNIKQVNKLTYAFLRRYPNFGSRLTSYVEEKKAELHTNHKRLLVLHAMKTVGQINNEYIVNIMGYTKDGHRSAKRTIAQKLGAKSFDDLESTLHEFTKA